MILWQASISLGLFIFMSTSFALCLIPGSIMPMQMNCWHSGSSVCEMHGEECCLTESGIVRVRSMERAPISFSRGGGFVNLQISDEDS